MEAAHAFHAARGHLTVPVGFCDASGYTNLRQWLNRQRAAHRAGKLDPGRAEELEALGIRW